MSRSQDFQFETDGFEQLAAMLRELPKRVKTRLFRSALKRAADFLENDIKGTSAWHDRTGNLRGSIRTRSRTRRGAVGLAIEGALYGRFLEFGWVSGKRPTTRGARSSRRRASEALGSFHPPRPWIRPAFEAHKQHAIDLIAQDLASGVQAVIRKHGGK